MGGWQGIGVSLILNLIQMAFEGGFFEDYLIHLLTGLFQNFLMLMRSDIIFLIFLFRQM